MESTEIFTQYRPAATDAELQQILELQQANLFDRIAPEVREREGFLKVQHTLALLRKMQVRGPQIIALRGRDLAGYALCMHPSQEGDIPVLNPLFEIARNALPPGSDFRIMGQICVSSACRRQGHFRKLYETLFEMCHPLPVVTEIASANTRSLEAHRAIGFRDLGSHQETDLRWVVMIWP